MKPYLVIENFFPKEEHFEDVLEMLKSTSEMMKEQEGALMSMSLKPEQKNGPITEISLWTSREKFLEFMKSEMSQTETVLAGLACRFTRLEFKTNALKKQLQN